MDIILVIGRLLFAALFITSGVAHLTRAQEMAAYASSKGVPGGRAAVQASGFLALLGGLSVGLGIWPDLGALLLVAFLAPVTLFMHAFWKDDQPATREADYTNFMKNIALLGAAVVMFAIVNQSQDVVGGVLSQPLFGRL